MCNILSADKLNFWSVIAHQQYLTCLLLPLKRYKTCSTIIKIEMSNKIYGFYVPAPAHSVSTKGTKNKALRQNSQSALCFGVKWPAKVR